MLLIFAAFAASPIALAQTSRIFTIGGEPFTQDEILDARYLPSIDGLPTILVTFSEQATLRLNWISKRFVGKQMPISLDGKIISNPVVQTEIVGDAVELSGLPSLADAVATAKLISGKDPLPDSLED